MACTKCSSDDWSQYTAPVDKGDEEKEKPDDEVELVSLDELEPHEDDD
jgi:hypothetical protein